MESKTVCSSSYTFLSGCKGPLVVWPIHANSVWPPSVRQTPVANAEVLDLFDRSARGYAALPTTDLSDKLKAGHPQARERRFARSREPKAKGSLGGR